MNEQADRKVPGTGGSMECVPSLTPTREIAVIVPTYGRPDSLERCLYALRNQTILPKEVLVVMRSTDTQSHERLANIRAGLAPLTVCPLLVYRPGKSRAVNAALESVTADIICFTDDDAEPLYDWIERIEKAFRSDIAGVGGRDLCIDETTGTMIEDTICHTVGSITWYGRLIGNHHRRLVPARPVKVVVLKGVNMAFRRDVIAGFRLDERLCWRGAHHDEMDICFFVRKRGGILIYDPLLLVRHFPAPRNWGAARGNRTMNIYEHSHNYTYLMMKHLPFPRRLAFLAYFFLVGPRASMGLVTGFLFLCLRGRKRQNIYEEFYAAWSGKTAGLGTYRRLLRQK